MTAMETLRLCRAAMLAAKQQVEEVRMLRALTASSCEEQAQIGLQLREAEAALAVRKRLYSMRAQAATTALLSLDGRDKQVLWMYFVLGFTIKQISGHLHLNYRDVLKYKAKAIKILEETEEKRT